MAKRRVVVTGIGVVSCFGTDVNHFYNELLSGKSGVRPIDQFECSDYPTRFAASVIPFETDHYIDKKQARRVDPFILYSVVAGKKALEYAQITPEVLSTLNKERCGVIIGSGMGGMTMFYEGAQTILNKGHKRLTPFFVPYIITNMGGAILAIDLGFMGPNYSMSTACATGNYSILQAAEHIRKGEADLMICGGAEAPITPVGLSGFVAIRAVSQNNDHPTKASKPWDKKRDGFVMGEGAGVLVLESLEHAQKRGAPILAEYLGGAVNCDAHHMTDPIADGRGVSLCISKALQDANVRIEEVNYINAHATSTDVGDLAEIRGIKKIFPQSLRKNIKMNATKSMIGHCLGAAGGIEAVTVVQAIQTGKLHPTINCDDIEPEVENFEIVRNEVVSCNIRAALSNSFGFGGHNSTLVFGPYKED